MPFKPLLRMARAWLDEPGAVELGALIAEGRAAADAVPEHRRGDWERLLAGLEKGEADPEPRTRARVEGLVRACRLFVEPPDPLDPVDKLPGIGPTSRAALADSGLYTVADLVWLPPVGFDDLRAPSPLAAALEEAKRSGGRGSRAVVSAVVKSASVVPIRGRRSVRLVVHDPSNDACKMHVFWFFMAHGVLAVAKPGAPVLLVGRALVEAKKPPRMAHPDLFADTPEMRGVRARYPKLGATGAAMRKAVAHALGGGLAPDPVPAAVAAREGMPEVGAVLREVHAVASGAGPDRAPPSEPARRAFIERLAFAEAFTRVWERLAADAERGAVAAPVLPVAEDAISALVRELGFAPTQGQREAIDEIARDLAGPRAMRRLLLGDVGTGKTAVALAAAAQCVRAGRQVAVLAPTSVLAEQYLDAVRPLERAIGARVAFVAAGMPAPARRAAEQAIREGTADVAVGTHALLREDVAFARLGLVVVDEQQRLGVAQRLSLVKKGSRPHLLTLSATPIPRTLALALRGELATSVLRERPANRPPVETSLAPASDLEHVVRRVAETASRKERVFWVVPRIDAVADADDDEDDVDPMASAIEREELLRAALPDARVVMLHGAMSAADKRAAMHAFRTGEADVLVGTTVVEVGVDVPEATLMVIEDAERFGLAQLHQLRGRVGRGARPGACVLLHGEPLEGLARERLVALTELSSGEEIARIDLELRGAGDLGGTRQHGVEEELVWLEPGATHPWLARIEEDARRIHASDAALAEPAHRVLGALVRRMRHVIAVREEAG